MPDPVLWVDGAQRPWRAGLDLATLLAELGVAPELVATACNGVFVARAEREATLLRPGDAVTLFAAIAGG